MESGIPTATPRRNRFLAYSLLLHWLIGLGLLFDVLLSAVSGYLPPWDQLSFWAIAVSTEMLAYVPIVGDGLRHVILGGDDIGPATAVVFCTTHTTVAPIALILLMTRHIWRVRLAGGVVLPAPRAGRPGDGERVPFMPDPLLREVAIEDGHVLVDTTRRIRRAAFEPEQVARVGSNA